MSTSDETDLDTTLGFDEDQIGDDRPADPADIEIEARHSIPGLIEHFATGEVEFLDFGAGTGRSVTHYEKMSGCRGAGIEIRTDKVRTAVDEGRHVYHGSIFDLPDDLRVRFVTADNVLEHLPTFAEVEAAIAAAKRAASDFMLIRHPSFEDEPYFHFHGVMPFWGAWTDHPSHVRLEDFAAMAHRLGVRCWEVHPVRRIRDTAAPELIPRSAGHNQQQYDPERHGPKDFHSFERQCYAAFDIVLHFSAAPRVELVYPGDTEESMRKPRLRLAEAGPAVA